MTVGGFLEMAVRWNSVPSILRLESNALDLERVSSFLAGSRY